jgi:hypothetical protein
MYVDGAFYILKQVLALLVGVAGVVFLLYIYRIML